MYFCIEILLYTKFIYVSVTVLYNKVLIISTTVKENINLHPKIESKTTMSMIFGHKQIQYFYLRTAQPYCTGQ
jgi:hypothetical protein